MAAGYEGIQGFVPDHADAAVAAGLTEVSGIGVARTVAEVRTVDRGDGPEEEVDRWIQADVLREIASRL